MLYVWEKLHGFNMVGLWMKEGTKSLTLPISFFFPSNEKPHFAFKSNYPPSQEERVSQQETPTHRVSVSPAVPPVRQCCLQPPYPRGAFLPLQFKHKAKPKLSSLKAPRWTEVKPGPLGVVLTLLGGGSVAQASQAAQIQPTPAKNSSWKRATTDEQHTHTSTCEILIIFLCFYSNIILHMRLGNILSNILSYLYTYITYLWNRNALLLLT